MNLVKSKANFARLCQLLVEKGGEALRRVLHAKIWPSDLVTELTANKRVLQKLKGHVINDQQWGLLYPSSGTPDSEKFDITLLTILIRNICGLPPPAKGWKSMPPASDCSVSANVLRIKLYRNEVYGHIARAQYDDATFEKLWHEISQPLMKLLVHRDEIHELKVTPLSPEEEIYIEKLIEWKNREDVLLKEMRNIREEFTKLQESVENPHSSKVEHLAKFNFTGKVDELCKKFQEGTRRWFFEKLSTWFNNKESGVMILTAGPGIGKSVLCAKVCEMYKKEGRLAAYQFCDYRNLDYKNPSRIIQSLASQMCDNIDDFRDELIKALRREHSENSLPDAFRVLLNDPLHALKRNPQPMLIVLDALDESKTDEKSAFLELISEEFSRLPKWIKILISSRPELQVKKELKHFNPFEIHPDDYNHKDDLRNFIQCSLPNLSKGNVHSLILKCEGSFLYAYYLVTELKSSHVGIEPSLSDQLPGISGFYEKQFKRLRTGLDNFKLANTLKCFVNVIAASKGPLPIKIVLRCMDLSGEEHEVRNSIIDIISEILPVYDNCITVYHKSLRDWLVLDGYEEHAFKADIADGIKRLWHVCRNVFNDIQLLKSISDFKCSPENRFALRYGAKYMISNISGSNEFQWLVNIRLNFLKLKFFGEIDVDYYHILNSYKYQLSDEMFWQIFRHNAFLNYADLHTIGVNEDGVQRKFLKYLQFFANGYFDFAQKGESCNTTARNILHKINEPWLEEKTNFSNSNHKMISNVVVEKRPHHVELSPDKMLLVFLFVYQFTRTAEVFMLPDLTLLFKVELGPAQKYKYDYSKSIYFAPDSSYFISNSVNSCISISGKKEVPFISHDCAFQSCSFSSCGLKLVTLEEDAIRLWDLKKKSLLGEIDTYANNCLFSSCNAFVFGFRHDGGYDIFDSNTLKRLRTMLPHTCFQCNDNVHVISRVTSHNISFPTTINWKFFPNLPTGETVVITDQHCSKPFTWKDRKCIMSWNSSSALSVYDCINQEVVYIFRLGFVPPGIHVSCIGKLSKTDFLIQLGFNQVLLLSLETSEENFVSPCNVDVTSEKITCSTFSPDNLYFVCAYENGVLKILSVDCGKTLQTIDLKQSPLDCYWSKLYLWVACEKGVIKLRKALTHTTVLENDPKNVVVEFPVKIYRVLKFAEGVLVFESFPHARNIYVLNSFDENRLQLQKISDRGYIVSSVAISSDGRACLFHRNHSEFDLWEIDSENNWQLVSKRMLEVDENHERFWFCLTGAQNSRCIILLTSDHIFSRDFSSSTQTAHKCELATKFNDYYVSDVIYVTSNILIVRQQSSIYFIDVLNGKTISKLYGSLTGAVVSYLPSHGVRLFVGNYGDIKCFTVRNIEKCLPLLFSHKYWQVKLTDCRSRYRPLWHSLNGNVCLEFLHALKYYTRD